MSIGLKGIPLLNDYTVKQATSEKPCWVCFKPSKYFLLASNESDFFFVCQGHLKDRSFCRDVALQSLKGDAKEVKRDAKEVKGDAKEVKGDAKDTQKEAEKQQKPEPNIKARYVLQSNFMYLRQQKYSGKRKAVETQTVMKQLPSVPK
jgi:hypothetical protein